MSQPPLPMASTAYTSAHANKRARCEVLAADVAALMRERDEAKLLLRRWAQHHRDDHNDMLADTLAFLGET